MSSTNGDAGSGIPQPSAQACLYRRSIDTGSTDNGIGMKTIGPAYLTRTYDFMTESAEVAWPGDGSAIGMGNNGCHSGCLGKPVLQFLEIFNGKQIFDGDLLKASQRLGEHHNPALQRLLHQFLFGNIRCETLVIGCFPIRTTNDTGILRGPKDGAIPAALAALMADQFTMLFQLTAEGAPITGINVNLCGNIGDCGQ